MINILVNWTYQVDVDTSAKNRSRPDGVRRCFGRAFPMEAEEFAAVKCHTRRHAEPKPTARLNQVPGERPRFSSTLFDDSCNWQSCDDGHHQTNWDVQKANRQFFFFFFFFFLPFFPEEMKKKRRKRRGVWLLFSLGHFRDPTVRLTLSIGTRRSTRSTRSKCQQ